jgi:flagellar hook assembly protein FlgD
LKIFDEREDLVKELVVDEMREKGKVYCDYWDGTTTDGRLVTNGMYYLVISYSEGSKEYYPIFVRRK